MSYQTSKENVLQMSWKTWKSFFLLISLLSSQLLPVSTFPSLLTMLTRGSRLFLQPGTSVELDCEFHSEFFVMFNMPVVWKKTQINETLELNVLGNLLPPFLNSNRFLVTFTNKTKRYSVRLSISEILPSDSGNYSCVVRGTRANVLGGVTHQIIVNVPVKSIRLSGPDVSLSSNLLTVTHNMDNARFDKHTFKFTLAVKENQETTLDCSVICGHPVPVVSIFLNDQNITPSFGQNIFTHLSGPPGFRLIKHEIRLTSRNLRFNSSDDESLLKCRTSFNFNNSRTAWYAVKVNVLYRPYVNCPPVLAHLGETNVKVTCLVSSRPNLVTLRWSFDDRSRTLVDDIISWGEYTTLVKVVNENTLQATLIVHKASLMSFRSYTLTAENVVGVGWSSTTLGRKSLPELAFPQMVLTENQTSSILRQKSHAIRHLFTCTIDTPGSSLITWFATWVFTSLYFHTF